MNIKCITAIHHPPPNSFGIWLDGVTFSDYQTISNAIAHTAKDNRLTVVRFNLRHYEKSIKMDKYKLDKKRIRYHHEIPELNYLINP